MVVRLSELLERIRPVGTPGAPTDAGPQRELVEAEEIAALVGELAVIEADADRIVVTARTRAEAIRSDADRSARRIRADLPDRVAVARAASASVAEHTSDDEIARIEAGAEAEIGARRTGADLDAIVARAVDVIWQSVDDAGRAGEVST